VHETKIDELVPSHAVTEADDGARHLRTEVVDDGEEIAGMIEP
jgi:hypothetical protein